MTLLHKFVFVFIFCLTYFDCGILSPTLAQPRTSNFDSVANEFDSDQTNSVNLSTKLGVYEVRPLREPISIDLEQINASSNQCYTLRLENKLGMDLFPVSISRSCNCVTANVPSDNWRDNSTIEFEVRITVGPSGGHLFDRN